MIQQHDLAADGRSHEIRYFNFEYGIVYFINIEIIINNNIHTVTTNYSLSKLNNVMKYCIG